MEPDNPGQGSTEPGEVSPSPSGTAPSASSLSCRRTLGILGVMVASCAILILVWWTWLSEKQGRIEDNVREFYEAQLNGRDQTENFKEHLHEQIRADYVEFVEETGPLEEYSGLRADLQAFGVSGVASIITKRNGVTYEEFFSMRDDKSQFYYFRAIDEDGNRTEFPSFD